MRGFVTASGADSGIELGELPEPDPAPDEALVAVRAFTVNRGEMRLIRKRPMGWAPGQDLAGVVIQAAEDGSGPPVGSRVCGLAEGGSWSERAVIPARRLAVLPDDVSFEVAATLPIAGTTAIRVLDLGGALIGHRVLITGAAGGVGTMAVQLASIGGADVTAVVGSPARSKGLEELGANEIVYQVADAEAPFKLILESVGGSSFESALEKVATHGIIVSFGNSSDTPSQYQFENMYHANGGRVVFFFNYQTTEEKLSETLVRLLNLVVRSKLRPAIGFSESWEHTSRALTELSTRKIFGKAVLHVEGP